MQIQIDASWQAPGGGHRGYAVVWEESDIDKRTADGLTRGQAIQVLSLQGEMLVVSYVHSQGGISAETHRARMEELRDAAKKAQEVRPAER